MLKNFLDFISRYMRALKSFNPFVSSALKKQFIIVAGLVFGVVVSNTLMIWLIGKPFNYMMEEDYTGLTTILFFLALVIAVNQFFHYQNIYRANVLGLTFVGELRNACLDHICQTRRPITDKFRKGDLLTRLSDDSDMVQRFVIESPLYFISHILTVVLYGIMLLVIDWQLAIFVIVLTPLFVLHQKIFAKPKAKTSSQFLAANGRLLAKEDEVLSNLRMVKAFNAVATIVTAHKHYFMDAFNWAVKERRLNALFSVTLASIVYLCALLVVYIGVIQIQHGTISVADLVSFLIYMGYLSVPIRGIADLGFQVQADIMAGERMLALFDLPTEEAQKTGTWHAIHGKIDMQGVSCQLGDKQVLQNVTLHLDAGKSYAIVGESGVGKSTFAQLLLGFLTPNSGQILIDDTPMDNISKRDLRNAISIVWQHPLLFNDTIRMNLCLANESASDEEIQWALELANAKGFVDLLPKGIDTEIGSNGVELSGGQRQRLHIAQVILRRPEIMIMDEATSALDSLAEEQVITNLQRVRRYKTTLFITHRYSSVKHVDQIIYLNTDGTVTQGTHEELLSMHEGYQHAIRWQTDN